MSNQNLNTVVAILLITGGVVHALPGPLVPLVAQVGVGAITLQIVIGVVSVMVGMYLLLLSK